MSVLEVKSLQQLTSIPEYTTGLLVVNFWAAWSEPSKQMNTVLEQLAKQYPQIKFAQVRRVLSTQSKTKNTKFCALMTKASNLFCFTHVHSG
jgi:thiol-disulfide isomerase/thioredoxin